MLGLSDPIMGGGALHETKMIDFRYKQYPQKISGYIAGVLNFQIILTKLEESSKLVDLIEFWKILKFKWNLFYIFWFMIIR